MITGDANEAELLLHTDDVDQCGNTPVSNTTSLRSIDPEGDVDRAQTLLSAEEAPEDTELSEDVERGIAHGENVQQTSGAEVHGSGNVVLRRAWFGLSDEIIPLDKHIQYDRFKTGSED